MLRRLFLLTTSMVAMASHAAEPADAPEVMMVDPTNTEGSPTSIEVENSITVGEDATKAIPTNLDGKMVPADIGQIFIGNTAESADAITIDSGANFPGGIAFRRHLGTATDPRVVTAGTQLGYLDFRGFSGGQYYNAGSLDMVVDGSVKFTEGDLMATKMRFAVSNGKKVFIPMELTANGRLEINAIVDGKYFGPGALGNPKLFVNASPGEWGAMFASFSSEKPNFVLKTYSATANSSDFLFAGQTQNGTAFSVRGNGDIYHSGKLFSGGRDVLGEITSAKNSAEAAAQSGQKAQSTADAALVIGNAAQKLGDEALAVGKAAQGTADEALAVGTAAQGTADEALAVGKAAQGTADEALAVGKAAQGTADEALAFGKAAQGTADEALVVGTAAQGTADEALAVGKAAQARGDEALAVGKAAQSTADEALAVGTAAQNSAADARMVGEAAGRRADEAHSLAASAQKTADLAVEVGTFATNRADEAYGLASSASSAVQANTSALTQIQVKGAKSARAANESIAIGSNALSELAGALAIGTDTVAAGRATAIGNGAIARGDAAVSVGTQSRANGVSAAAFGDRAIAAVAKSTAIGSESLATATSSTAIGAAAQAIRTDAVALGSRSLSSGAGAVAIGNIAVATAERATAIGQNARAGQAGSTAIGAGSQTTAENQVMLGAKGTSVVVADIDASTKAQQGPVDVVTVDASGVLGRQRVATTSEVQTVRSYVDAVSAISDTQFRALEESVTSLNTRVDSLFDLASVDRKDTRQGLAAVAAMANPMFPSEAGKTSYASNVATYRGEVGFSAGLMHRFEGDFAVTAGVTYAGGNSTSFKAGVAGEF